MEDNEVVMLLAAKLYEQGKLSLGRAAELDGLKKEPLLNCLADMVFRFLIIRLPILKRKLECLRLSFWIQVV
jgi:hypothetical protein